MPGDDDLAGDLRLQLQTSRSLRLIREGDPSNGLGCWPWHVDVRLDHEESDDSTLIGRVDAIVIDTWQCPPFEALDDVNQDLSDMAGVLDEEGPLQEALGRDFGRLLIIDQVVLDKAHRGKGLGPVVAALVIDTLGPGCDAALLQPAPVAAEQLEASARDVIVQKLAHVWEQVGFRRLADTDYWYVDLERTDFEEARARLFL